MAAIHHHDYIVGRIENINAVIVPDYLIVSLGTNDLGYDGGPSYAEFYNAISGILGAVDSSTEVFWVKPHHPNSMPDQLVKFNRALEDATAGFSNAEAVDFEDWLAPQGIALYDTLGGRWDVHRPGDVHFSVYGAGLYASFINELIGE